MKTALLITLLGISATLFGQESAAVRTFDLRLYSSTYILHSRWHSHRPNELRALDWAGPSFAFSTSKGIRVHEWEAAYWTRTEETPEYRYRIWQTHFRYETGVYLSKKLFEQIRIRLAGSSMLFYHHQDGTPIVANRFEREVNHYGVAFDFVVHFELPISERLFADLNLSTLNSTFSLRRSYSYNPFLPERQRELTSFDIDASGLRLLRLGLSYRL